MPRLLLSLAIILFTGFTVWPASSPAQQGLRLDLDDGLGLRDAFDGRPLPDDFQAFSREPIPSPSVEVETEAPDSDSHALPDSQDNTPGPFLGEGLAELLGDFSVQSQMIYVLTDQPAGAPPASLVNGASGVANVFLGLQLFHLEQEQTERPGPWSAYMGFSYAPPGLGPDTGLDGQSPFSGPERQDQGITTHFGVNITF